MVQFFYINGEEINQIEGEEIPWDICIVRTERQ